MAPTGDAGASADRWRSGDGEAAAAQAWRSLVAGRPASPYGEVDGRVDLRGLPAPTAQMIDRYEFERWFVEQFAQGPTVRGVTLRGLDLSGAWLHRVRCFDVTWEDCRFDGAHARAMRWWGSTVTRSSFERADLREAGIGTGRHQVKRFGKSRPNTWEAVSFRGADLRGSVLDQARLLGGDLSMARLDQLRFAQCELAGLTFAGVIREAFFDGRAVNDVPAPPPMVDVDFSRAVLESVTFLGYSLGGVRLPDDPDVRVIPRYRQVLMAAMEDLAADGSEQAQVLLRMLQYLAKPVVNWPEADHLFNRRDFVMPERPGIEQYADDVFRRAEARLR